MILKLWDIGLIKDYKHSTKDFSLKYFKKCCFKFFEFFKQVMIKSWSNSDKIFVVGSQGVQEV